MLLAVMRRTKRPQHQQSIEHSAQAPRLRVTDAGRAIGQATRLPSKSVHWVRHYARWADRLSRASGVLEL